MTPLYPCPCQLWPLSIKSNNHKHPAQLFNGFQNMRTSGKRKSEKIVIFAVFIVGSFLFYTIFFHGDCQTEVEETNRELDKINFQKRCKYLLSKSTEECSIHQVLIKLFKSIFNIIFIYIIHFIGTEWWKSACIPVGSWCWNMW